MCHKAAPGKKILFVTVYPSPYRVDFFNELGRRDGIELTVAFLERACEQAHRAADWFHEDYRFFRAVFLEKRVRLPKGLFLCTDILDLLKQPYDEIIFGGYNDPSISFAMAWLKSRGIKYSIEIDGGLISADSRPKYLLKRALLSSADKWYSSGSFSDRYLIHYGAAADRIYHYPFTSLKEEDLDTATDWPACAARKQALREKLAIREEKMALAIGQFIPRKGFDVLLAAAVKLPSSVGVYIIGGEAPGEYRAFLARHRLHNVHLLGFRKKEALEEYYRAADLFVLPTRDDIWGLVVGEAMANGLPVVTTERCVAGQELVRNGENGYIVPVDDAAALADAMQRVLSSDPEKMRKRSLEIMQDYTIEKMADAHIRAFAGACPERQA